MFARVMGAKKALGGGEKGHENNDVLSLVLIGDPDGLRACELRILMSFRI